MIMDKKKCSSSCCTLKLFFAFFGPVATRRQLGKNNTTAAINVSKHKSHEGRHRLLQDAQSAQK